MKKRILFISHSSTFGGAEKCLSMLIQGLDPDAYGGTVLVPQDGPLVKQIESCGWKVRLFPITWWIGLNQRNLSHFRAAFAGMPERVRRLRCIIRELDIDLVYTNTITCMDGAVSAKLEKIPHIWHIHEVPTLQPFFKFYCPIPVARFLVHCLSARVIVPSNIVKNDLRNDLEKVRVISNGVNVTKFGFEDNHRFREEMGFGEEIKVVGMIGSLNENKCPLDFIEAARMVAQKVDNVKFCLIGTGARAYVDALAKRIRELDLSETVLLIGFREDIEEILAAVDIVISASRVETFSLAVAEAMAAGKPVVATKSGGPQDIIEDGVNGILIECAHPQEMAEAIVNLLKDETKAKEMGRKGRKRVETLFSAERYTSRIQQVIGECL